MTRTWWGILTLIAALLVVGVAAPLNNAGAEPAAQTGGGPLVLLKDGDLWRWDGASLTQLSTWGYNERPVLSPDGTRVAYNSWAQITVNAIAAGKPVFGIIPSNIWVMDVTTGDAQRVADQPANAVFFQDGVADVLAMRGTPVWSPDGSQLAWAEYVMPSQTYQLVVYTFATNTTQVIVPVLPYPFADAGFFPVHTVLWGNRGLLVINGAVSNASYDFEETAYLYAPQNGALIHEEVIGSSATEWAFNTQWVQYDGQEYLGLHYPSGKIYLVDPATGDRQDMPALPELYSRSTPGGASAFTAPNTTAEGTTGQTWTAVYPTRTQDQLLAGFTGDPTNIAIAPNGQAIAYVSDALHVWQNGTDTVVPGTEGVASPWDVAVVWGPTAWRVCTDWPGAGGGFGGGAVGCFPAPRLTVGGTGQVTPGLPNVLRNQPRRGQGSTIVGQIPGGGVFSVLSGPQCGPEGRYWWQVNYQGTVGWTAEGEGGVYWLQPYQVTPVCGPTPRLTVNTTAYVLPGLPNVLRSQPYRTGDSVVIGRIPGNGVFTVLSGPQCGPEGRYWWYVNYAGLQGWTAEGEGSVYWTAPFGCPMSPAPRLAPYMQATVTPGLPNRLRSGPGTNYQQIGSIPAGGVITVLSGPQCGPEGWSYWRVQYGSQIGYTAEGDGATYWLEPVGYTPPTPEPVACTLTPRMILGVAGRVTPGLPNVIRSEPNRGASSVVLGEMPGGAFFAVEGGPICGPEGRYWWRVQYQGISGWTPEGEGSTYWIEPWAGDGPSTPSCTLAPRLAVGTSAYVIPGPSNVLRNNPGTGANSSVIGQIPGGGYFYVLDGPQCGNDGRYWWYVNYQGTTGWTGEGENGNYWVAPFSCSFSPPTRLVPGGIARVTPGEPNVIRSAPGTDANSTVIGQIPGGGTVSVLAGPQCGSDGRVWWQVNYQGTVGWTAEGEGSAYWMEPLY